MGIRIEAAPITGPQPDAIDDTLAIIFATKSSREFAACVRALANRDHYADAANRLQCAVTGRVPDPNPPARRGDPARVETVTQDSLIRALYLGGEFKVSRVARGVHLIASDYGDSFTLAELLPDQSRKARVAAACLGYVGGVPWEESSPLPSNRRERAGLALNLLVRGMFP